MIHLKNSGYLPKDAKRILLEADNLVSDMHAIVRDVRVSSKSLEFDVSVSKEYVDALIKKLEKIGPLDNKRLLVEEEIEKDDAIEMGRQYFNSERFWECHEILEGVWKKTFEKEKDTVQGIILVAAAFVHYQKNEEQICLSIMKRALEKLDNESYHEIDIGAIQKKVSGIIQDGKIHSFTI